MTKTDKVHPADMQAIEAIASAKSFSVTIFKGATHHHIIEFADAIEAGRLMENIDGSGRKSMVYAITQEGASIMIPRTLYHLTDHALMEKALMTTPQANGAAASAQTGRRSAAMSAIAALKSTTTPAPDAGKTSTAVDLTETKPGIPAFCDADKNKDARDAARAKPVTPTAIPQADTKKVDAQSTESPVTRASLKAQISAASSSKASAAAARKLGKRRERAASPDAIKPIVPLRGPALAEFLAAWAKAEKGHLPSAPDFTAETHKPYRDELKALIALAKAGDLEKLKADRTQPTWNSRTQIVRYRVLSIRAIEAQKNVKTPTIVPGLDKALKAAEAPAAEKPKTTDKKGGDAKTKKRSVSEAAANLRAAKTKAKKKK